MIGCLHSILLFAQKFQGVDQPITQKIGQFCTWGSAHGRPGNSERAPPSPYIHTQFKGEQARLFLEKWTEALIGD